MKQAKEKGYEIGRGEFLRQDKESKVHSPQPREITAQTLQYAVFLYGEVRGTARVHSWCTVAAQSAHVHAAAAVSKCHGGRTVPQQRLPQDPRAHPLALRPDNSRCRLTPTPASGRFQSAERQLSSPSRRRKTWIRPRTRLLKIMHAFGHGERTFRSWSHNPADPNTHHSGPDHGLEKTPMPHASGFPIDVLAPLKPAEETEMKRIGRGEFLRQDKESAGHFP